MRHLSLRCALIIMACTAGACLVSAQNDMRGHWTGAIETPAGSMGVEIDLDKTADGWIGSMSIPMQNASGLPLEAISFSDGKGTFRIKGAPGDPTFTGSLSADGKTLDGQMAMGTTIPLKLSWTGAPNVALIKPSPAVALEFLGKWEGTLQAGPGLRLVLTISNGKAGSEATLVSVDQGNAQIPVSGITQREKKLTLQVDAVGGGYEGEISADGTQLSGTWTQSGNSFPLTLKKSAAAASRP